MGLYPRESYNLPTTVVPDSGAVHSLYSDVTIGRLQGTYGIHGRKAAERRRKECGRGVW